MKYDNENAISISGWNNNCGLASIAHFLQEKIDAKKLPTFLKKTPYQKLLASFRKIYQNPRLTWNEIQNVLQTYAHPYDKGAIWSLALRDCLQEAFLNNKSYRKLLLNQFEAVISALLDGKSLDNLSRDYGNIIESNKDFFELILLHIKKRDGKSLRQIKKEIYNIDLIEKYWKQIGYLQYCIFLGVGKKGNMPMLTADEMSEFCKFLKIRLNVYGPNSSEKEVDFSTPYRTVKGYSQIIGRIGKLNLKNFNNHWERLIDEFFLAERHNLDVKRYCPILIHDTEFKSAPKMVADLVEPFNTQYETKINIHRKKDLLLYKALSTGTISKCVELLRDGASSFSFTKNRKRIIDQILEQGRVDAILSLIYLDKRSKTYILNYFISRGRVYEVLKFEFQLKQLLEEVNRVEPNKTILQVTPEKINNIIKELLLPVDSLEGDSDFHKSIRNGGIFGVDSLYRHLNKNRLDKENYKGITPLHLLVLTGGNDALSDFRKEYRLRHLNHIPSKIINFDKFIKRSFTYSFDVNHKDIEGLTTLHYAALIGNHVAIEILVDLGADITLKDKNGNTPLHLAVKTEQVQCIEKLVDIANKRKMGSYINTPNSKGETPFAMANRISSSNAFAALICGGIVDKAKPKHIFPHLIKVIELGSDEVLDRIVSTYPELCSMRYDNKYTLAHHCAKNLKYRMLHIVLHPLSEEERYEACRSTKLKNTVCRANDKKGLQISRCPSAYELLKKEKPTKNVGNFKEKIQQYDKVHRLLAAYDDSAKDELPISGIHYQWKWNHDIQAEITSTSGYMCASTIGMSLAPACRATSMLLLTGNPVLAAGAAFDEFFGKDAIDRCERITAMASSAPGVVGTTAYFSNYVFWLANWYRNTTTKTINLGTRITAAKLLSSGYGEMLAKSYLTYLNAAGVVYYFAEGVGANMVLGPMLSQHFRGIESIFTKQFDIPTMNEIASSALTLANDTYKDLTEVDVQEGISSAYKRLVDYFPRNAYSTAAPGWNGKPQIRLGEPIFLETPRVKLPDSKTLVQTFQNLAVGQSDKPGAVAEGITTYLMQYYRQLNPNKSEQEYKMHEEALKNQLLKDQSSSHVSSHDDRLARTVDTFISTSEQEATTILINLCQPQSSGSMEVFMGCATKQFVNILNLPANVGNDSFILGFQLLIGRYYGEPKKLEWALGEWISFVGSPGHNTKDAIEILFIVSDLAAQHLGKNFGNFFAKNLIDLQILNGTLTQENYQQTYERLSYDVNHKRFSIRSSIFEPTVALKDIYESAVKISPSIKINQGTEGDNIAQEAKNRASDPKKEQWAQQATFIINEKYPEYLNTDELINATATFLTEKSQNIFSDKINMMLAYYGIKPLIEPFKNNQSLNAEFKSTLNRFMPRDVRAAYSVHEVTMQINSSPGYNSLTVEEEYELLNELHSQTSDEKFEQIIFDIISDKRIDQSSYENLSDGSAPAGFAAAVTIDSKKFAQNQWNGTHHHDQRAITMNDKDKPLLKIGKFIISGVISNGIGTQVDGQGIVSAGIPGGIYFELNPKKPSEPLFTINKTPTAPSLSAVKESQKQDTELLVQGSSSLPKEQSVGNDSKNSTQKEDNKKDQTKGKNKEIEKAQPMQSNPIPSLNLSINSNASTSISSVMNGLSSASPFNAGMYDPMQIFIEYVTPKVMDPYDVDIWFEDQPANGFWGTVGGWVLDSIVKPAQASASRIHIIPRNGGQTIGPVGLRKPDQDEWGFPIHPDDNSPYWGWEPEEKRTEDNGYTYPSTSQGRNSTETLVDQPGEKNSLLTFPVFPSMSLLLYYSTVKNIKNGLSSIIQGSGNANVYDDNYKKHEPRPDGMGALWDGASVNPIPNKEIGQQLLDTSYVNPKNKNERFNYYNGKIIKFRSSNDSKS